MFVLFFTAGSALCAVASVAVPIQQSGSIVEKWGNFRADAISDGSGLARSYYSRVE